ncbi:hypothetical protein ACHAXT_003130 [Thalassiosira profunda]
MHLARLAVAAVLVARASAFGAYRQPFLTPPCIQPSTPINPSVRRPSTLHLSGGFGGAASSKAKNKKGKKGGPAPSSNKKMSPGAAKRATKQLAERYGGDIGKGTQARIQTSLEALEPHLREAAELYKAIAQFDALVAPMTTADFNRLIPPVQVQMADADRKKLEALMEEHNISDNEIHNIYQRITWDASADAKATQADIVGNKMKPELQERITKALSFVVETTESEGAVGKILDVGCGHGALVPSLSDAGLKEPDMYHGIDLSPEMIKNAVERYGSARNGRTGKGREFVAGDFLTHYFGDDGTFDSVLFCSALHDLPDQEAAIAKAASLLRSGGKIVVVHAQGAQHVLGQNQANPILVKRGLPTAAEWSSHSDCWALTLEHAPADPRSDGDMRDGYLAVLVKR